MFSASRPLPPTASFGSATTPLERRLAAEWDLLHRLAARNPQRLTSLAADDLSFRLRLLGTPGLCFPPEGNSGLDTALSEHEVTLVFPRFFPAAPLELYLSTPLQHPNIHPVTGFVCLWDRHRVSNTVEHALHKLVAILGWRLYNREAVHVMQREALARMEQSGAGMAATLSAPPLLGVEHDEGVYAPALTGGRRTPPRQRLS